MPVYSALLLAYVGLVCLLNYLFPRRARCAWLLVCSWFFYLYAASPLPKALTELLPQSWPVQLLFYLPQSLLTRLPQGLLEEMMALQPLPPTAGLPQNFWQQLAGGLPALYLLAAVSLGGWLCGLAIGRLKGRAGRRVFLALGLLCCLGLLAGCKYLGMYGVPAGPGGLAGITGFVLPLGLSWFTVQSAVYLFDVYAKRCAATANFIHYALFTGFFPGLFVGPVNRAAALLPQIALPAAFNYKRVAGGAFRVLWGLVKTLLLAGGIGLYTGGVFGGGAGGSQLAAALLLFPCQLYFSLGGCCDIAVGAAGMLGLDFAESFARPFAAKTFAALWQRWHTSLLGPLREMVFTPLAAGRLARLPGGAVWAPLLAALALFAAYALWHAALPAFLLWGLCCGLAACLARLFAARKEEIAAALPLYRVPRVRGGFQRVFTYLLFTLCIVFFAEGLHGLPVFSLFGRLFTGWDAAALGGLYPAAAEAGLGWPRLAALGAALALVALVEKFAVKPADSVALWIRRRRWFARWPLYWLLVAALLLFGVFDGQTPIYQLF